MAFLTLDGTEIEVQHAGASEDAPTYVGESARAFDGSYRTGVRAAKRQWSFTLIPMLQPDFDALLTLVGLELPLTASGDFNGGVDVPVVARVNGRAYTPDGTGAQRIGSLTLIEV